MTHQEWESEVVKRVRELYEAGSGIVDVPYLKRHDDALASLWEIFDNEPKQ